MKTGRNDPCPCGSGLKYKNCCMTASSRPSLRAESPYVINERIAYKGSVGRERKKWSEVFIEWKVERLAAINAAQTKKAATTGKCISCSKGCSFCCSQHIGATLQECDAIVYWLSLHPEVRERFFTRYPVWRNRLREHEDVFKETNQAASAAISSQADTRNVKEFMQAAEKYLKLDIPCPFLDDDGTCSIYPVRPLVCASLVVVSPPEHCKASSSETPELLLWPDTNEIQPPYFRGPEKSVTYSCAPLLVNEIINGGFIYINDLPGLAGLEKEVFDDPEIRALFR